MLRLVKGLVLGVAWATAMTAVGLLLGPEEAEAMAAEFASKREQAE